MPAQEQGPPFTAVVASRGMEHPGVADHEVAGAYRKIDGVRVVSEHDRVVHVGEIGRLLMGDLDLVVKGDALSMRARG